MSNPQKSGNYTTIFRDGSIIHENSWLIFPDGHGKWYWDEEVRGGVVAWTEIPEGGYKYHKFYRLPDWELRELVNASLRLEALYDSGVYNWEWYEQSMDDYLSRYYAKSFEELIDLEMHQGYYSGYEYSK